MRGPVIALSISCTALMTFFSPRLTGLLVYERQAVYSGEVWRILTAPLVHFSSSHLFWNLLVFTVVGGLTELSGYRRFGTVCALSAALPGLLYLLASPDLSRYGGLSAVATGACAYFFLCRIRETSGTNRMLWSATLALLLVKLFIEGVADAPLFARSDGQPFSVLPSAHATGIAVATAIFIFDRITIPDRRQSSPGNAGNGTLPH